MDHCLIHEMSFEFELARVRPRRQLSGDQRGYFPCNEFHHEADTFSNVTLFLFTASNPVRYMLALEIGTFPVHLISIQPFRRMCNHQQSSKFVP